MAIRVLSADTAAKIAAGEVVERPVSVVKELVENSIDSMANSIDVQVRDGGVGLIRVVDDGCGISPDEIQTAFARYATSKLATPEDLEQVKSLGFRGEALASIASVSDVMLLTRTRGDLAGCFARLEEGRVVDSGPRAAPPGTSITVERLFGRFPARLKFLKSKSAETNRIAHLVSLYALAYPNLRFTLRVDEREAFFSEALGDLRASFAAVYGVPLAESMLALEREERNGDLAIRVAGLVSPPDISRANRTYITFFVNRRLIQSQALTYAVLEAYKGFLMTGRYPLAVVDLTIDPSQIDVNVHPTKAEIRFLDEGAVFSAIRRAVLQALTASTLARPTQLGNDSSASRQLGQPFPDKRAALTSLGQLGSSDPTTRSSGLQHEGVPTRQGELPVPILRVVGQLGRTYVVAEGPDGMYLIDQHAAHERIVLDRLQDVYQGEVESQGLLEPLTVELSPRQEGFLDDGMDTLTRLGFDVEPFGIRTVLLRAIPAGLTATSPGRALLDILDGLDRSDIRGLGWKDRVLITVACHSSIRAGQDLHTREMEELLRQLEVTEHPRTCPHGRPTMLHMSTVQIDKEFDRR